MIKMTLASFEIAVRVGDVRAEDDGIEEYVRCLLALVKLELLSHVLEHALQERRSRATARAIKYQNPFITLPVIPSCYLEPLRRGGGGGRDSPFPQPRIRGNKPLDRVFKTLMRMSSVQKPCGPGVNRIRNGLASSWPTGLDQTLLERLWQSLVESNIGLRFQENPGERHGQRSVLVLMRSGQS